MDKFSLRENFAIEQIFCISRRLNFADEIEVSKSTDTEKN